MPVSTAATRRFTRTTPAVVDFHLGHGGDEAAERGLRGDAAARRGAAAASPSPPFSATRFERGEQRGAFCLALSRRKSTGSLPALRASSSMKLSIANTLLLGPTPRQKPVGTAWRFVALVFDLQVRNVVGNVDGAIDRVDVDAFLKSRRQPARDDRRAGDPVLPANDLAVRNARRQIIRDRPAGRHRAGCLPRGSRPPSPARRPVWRRAPRPRPCRLRAAGRSRRRCRCLLTITFSTGSPAAFAASRLRPRHTCVPIQISHESGLK